MGQSIGQMVKGACPFCGGDLLSGYKKRKNSYKCVKCHRWIVGKLEGGKLIRRD